MMTYRNSPVRDNLVPLGKSSKSSNKKFINLPDLPTNTADTRVMIERIANTDVTSGNVLTVLYDKIVITIKLNIDKIFFNIVFTLELDLPTTLIFT